MASARDEHCVLAFRKFLLDLSAELSRDDLKKLKFASIEFIPRGKLEDVAAGFELFDLLEQCGKITRENLSLLNEVLETIGRNDLARKVQQFASDDANTPGNVDDDHTSMEFNVSDGSVSLKRSTGNRHAVLQDDMEHDGIGDKPEKTLPFHDARNHTFGDVECDGVGGEPEKTLPFHDARNHTFENQEAETVGAFCVSAGLVSSPPSFSTVSGTSGAQGRKSTPSTARTSQGSKYTGCNLDISFDAYDIGGWVVDGGQEITIERSACEAKKFTFYCVKRAPKEAGIEPGRDENGLVKCVFTPEAFVVIPVIIPGSSQPLIVNFTLSASVGDLKTEIQRQLHKSPDLDQLRSLNHKVLANHTLVSDVKTPVMILQLIDAELDITIKGSTHEVIHVRVRPSQGKVNDVMKQVETRLGGPIKDQKMYHGKMLLSDTPLASLGIYTGSQLKVEVRVLFISVSITDLPGFLPWDHLDIRCNPKETFKDLLNHIQSRTNIEKIDGATFLMKGRIFDPTQDLGSLHDYGIDHRSSLAFRMTEPQTDKEYNRKQRMELDQDVSKREEEYGFEGPPPPTPQYKNDLVIKKRQNDKYNELKNYSKKQNLKVKNDFIKSNIDKKMNINEKQDLIDMILEKNKSNTLQKSTHLIHRSVKENIIQPPIEFRDKPIPTPRKNVKKMIENYEENIIQHPIQFQDKPIPLPRTKINIEKMKQKYEDNIKKSI
ncbi:uncharacterized protein [Montipora capricornis]|uniref:uncharacterized protein n=1 Tax=Montipora capricornis TaxID=246305 RepID=UPI0035F208BA